MAEVTSGGKIANQFADPLDLFGFRAADKATEIQRVFAELGLNLEKDLFNELRADSEPVRQTRDLAINRLMNLNEQPESPALGYQQADASRRIRNSAAARGKLNSGGRYIAEQDSAAGLASNSINQSNNQLLRLSGFEIGDLNQNNSLLQQNVGSQTNGLLNLGNINAAGQIAQQNGFNNLLNQSAQAFGGFR